MEILGSVTAKMVELTVEPIGRQVGYLLYYGNNFKELKNQVEDLQTSKERIDREIEGERRNGREIESDVLRWQESVIQTLEEAKQLCEDPRDANARCSKWPFPNLKSRHQRSRKAMKMANTIVEMKGKGNFDKGVGYVPRLDITNKLSTVRGSDELGSRNSVKAEIVLSLKDPKVNKIGLYGIGGVGKTTLVKEVAKQVKVDKLFDEVVMVTISQSNLEKTQDEIAEQLGLHLEEKTTSIGRANRLCERIKKEKTILIILDDLRAKIDLDKLGIPFLDTSKQNNSEKVGVPLKDDYKGCRLLLTSRSQDILQKHDTQKNFSLQVLNLAESWSLFEAMVGDIVKDDDFRTIATQVAQRCVGLPVLIVTIAKSLKYNDNIYYWKDTLNNLKGVDNKDIHGTLLSALEFNFNQLEDEVKKVFLLCGVHGTSILVNDLLKYVIGLGIFKCINTIEDARIRLYRIIDDLKKSCLLVDDDAGTEMAKMHDIVHEVAILIASKYAFPKINTKWQDWQRSDIPERCTQIILKGCLIQKLPERLDCPHLTFLHINSTDNRTLEIPDSFFEGAENLEALNLTCMIISSLPISFSSLTKLKTLCLDWCILQDISRIGALLNLDILSLMASSIERFPSEIEQLTKLRILDLSKSGIGTTLPNILCKLTKIEELYMGDALINWEVESSTKQKRNVSLAKLQNLTTLELQVREARLLPKDIPFDKLERYKVVIGEKWEWLGNKGTSRLLKVKLDTNIHWERGIKTLIERVEDLYLDEISGVSNVLFELNGKGFPFLKHLHVQNNGEIQHIINSVERDQTHVLFPKLETLLFHNLNNLVKICQGPIRENSFCKLKVLKVKNCDQLVYLFSVSMVKACSQIVEIQVSECNSMKRIVSIESADRGNSIDEKIGFLPLRSLTLKHLPTIDEFCSHELRANVPSSFFSAKVKFYNLETLKLSSVNLKNIWDDNQFSAPYLIQNLANLTVEDCSGLKYLFSSSLVGGLSNLKQLEISKCDMMEEIIATEEISGAASGEVLFPKLETILIKDMKNLKTIWHLILASNSLAYFKTLEVKNCEKIEKIFPEYMNGAFASLETLKVEDCKSVKEIFQLDANADHTTQLKYITLLFLPQLKKIWSRSSQSSLHFKNLQVMRVEGCGDLEYLFPFSIAKHLPQLEAITIKNAHRMTEIVLEREEPLDHLIKFEFYQLTSIVLWNLQDLQGFCVGNHSLFCSSLKALDVYKCPKLKLFKKQDTSSQGRPSDVHVSTQQPLFTLEEVIDNLEHLHLNNEDAIMIFQSQVPRDQFRKLNFLRLADLEDAQGISPYWFLQNISSLECLVIERSPFKVIFPHQMPQDENGEIEIKTRLKMLTLYKLDELQHICQEGCQLDPVLDVLEYLDVDECPNLKHLVPCSVTFNHLMYLEVQNCSGLIYLMTSSTAQCMVNLIILKIRECDLIERILEEDRRESNCEIEFSVLEVLELESLPKLNSFCSNNCSLKLPLLEKLVIRQCPRLKAFAIRGTNSPLLREILTDEKDGKWFCYGDLNSTVNKIFQQMVAFRSMERLELSRYPELGGDVWYSLVKHGIFGNLKSLVIHKCDFLSEVLLPLNLLKELSKMEDLEVRDCDSLEALFELPNMNEGGIVEKVTIHLKTLNLFGLPELKHIWKQNSQEIEAFENFGEIPSYNNQGMHASQIQCLRETTKEGDIHYQPPTYSIAPLKQSWSRDPQESHRFCNMEVVHVEHCDALEYLFPFSIATDLLQLEQIIVKYSDKMKEIVSNKEESLDCPPKFEFNHLSSLVLWGLPELQVFYSKSHSLQCPSLKKLDVRNCLKWSLFNKHGTSGKGKVLDGNLEVSTQQLNFPLKEVICNLEMLALNCEDASEIVQGQFSKEHLCKLKLLILSNFEDEQATFPYWFLQNMTSLEELIVEFSSFKEIFQHDGKNGIQARIKLLTLNQLPELESMCKEGCQIDPVFEVLEGLLVDECSNLKNLVPSSVTFNHLKCLEVQNCIALIYLIASSTARSLVNLTTMKIRECDSVKEIVTEGEESINEIVFICLEVLELESLPKLKLFSSSNCFLKLPRLNKLVIKQCPRMKSFSVSNMNAPRLQKIHTEKQNGKWCWEGDLNGTVDKIFQDKVAFSSFNDLELSKYPELEQLWYGQVGQKTFCNLKHLVVCKCTFLSNVLFSSNLLQLLFTLEELEVAECDSLEAVFDLKALDGKEIESKEVSRLKKLKLSRLPNLKSIWNGEAGEIISYGNLQIVKVDKCQHLKNLFSVSLCQDLRQLEELHIESCGVEEIVSVEEGLEELKFDFPQLTTLVLFNLTRLTNFYPKRYTLECSSLKKLKVRGCEALQIFAFDPLNAKLLKEGDIDLKSIALFYIEKVPRKLEELPLNEKDTMMILNGNYEKNLFQSIKRLCLQQFQETPIKFLNNLIQIFSAITTLQVRCSSFEALFPSKEIGHCNIESATQIKTLWLFQLQKLEHIWNVDDDSASHPLVQNLEYLIIDECPSLIRLAPPSASFKTLTSLKVKDCNGLMYFMTTCTARSLVHLTSLQVSNCGMLEEAVMTDDEESEEEITFESLKYLELNCLSSFRSICSGKHTFIFPSLVTLRVIGCHKMQNFSSGVIIAPFLKLVEVENQKKHWIGDLNTTIKQLFMEKAIEEGVEGDYRESLNINKQSSHIHQNSASTSRALSSEEHVHGEKSKADETVYNLAMGTEEMNEDNQTPFTEEVKSTLSNASVQETGVGTQETQESKRSFSVPEDQNVLITTVVNDTAIGTEEMNETMQTPFTEVAESTLTHTSVQEADTENREIYETIQRPLVQHAEDTLITTSVQDIATGTHVMHENIHKPFAQATQNAWEITIVQTKGESHDSDIHLSKNLFHQSTTFSVATDYKKIVGTQETYESKRRFSAHNAQNVLSPIHHTAIDPAPSQASNAPSSSTTSLADVCSNFKELDISLQLLPYLEAGVKQHPQVLNWLNTKRRTVFASSSFSLFAEVTRILRTTRRRVNLTEDDRSYIRECCAVLQGVGFDDGWISYVLRRIEACADGEDLEWTVEEAEAQLESINKDLASMEESLRLLRDKTSRLHDYICYNI